MRLQQNCQVWIVSCNDDKCFIRAGLCLCSSYGTWAKSLVDSGMLSQSVAMNLGCSIVRILQNALDFSRCFFKSFFCTKIATRKRRQRRLLSASPPGYATCGAPAYSSSIQTRDRQFKSLPVRIDYSLSWQIRCAGREHT